MIGEDKMKFESTKQKLAWELRNIGLDQMAARAEAGYYDDFESDFAFPISELVRDLKAAGARNLAHRAANGEFDSTKEEAEAWYMREGKYLENGTH